MLKGIYVSVHNSESGMVGCGSSLVDEALKLICDHHFLPYQIQGENMEKTQLQDCSIL